MVFVTSLMTQLTLHNVLVFYCLYWICEQWFPVRCFYSYIALRHTVTCDSWSDLRETCLCPTGGSPFQVTFIVPRVVTCDLYTYVYFCFYTCKTNDYVCRRDLLLCVPTFQRGPSHHLSLPRPLVSCPTPPEEGVWTDMEHSYTTWYAYVNEII